MHHHPSHNDDLWCAIVQHIDKLFLKNQYRNKKKTISDGYIYYIRLRIDRHSIASQLPIYDCWEMNTSIGRRSCWVSSRFLAAVNQSILNLGRRMVVER